MRRALLLFLLLALPSPGASSRSLIAAGNSAYQSEEYDKALEAYRQAEEASPNLAVAAFNRGAAHYRREEIAEAVAAFQQAAQLASVQGASDVEALAEYNLGNALFRSSAGYERTDPQTSLAALEKSAASYKRALARDPGLGEAARNMELARLRMKQILDRLRDQPQGGRSDDPDDSDSLEQKLSENLQKQQELNRERDELDQKQQRNPRDRNLQQEAQQQAERQKQLEQDSREMAEQLKQQTQQQRDPEKQQAREQLEQAAAQQRQAGENLEQQQLGEAEQPQKQAAQSMQQALDALQGKAGEQQQQQQQQQAGNRERQQPPSGDPLQALRQAPQDILNEERANRRRRELLQLGSPQPVEKDW
jgi:tetratricopeptide (TPR) repeat protein